MEISQAIKETADELGCMYLRATPSDANERTERQDYEGQTLVIYSNQPIVSYALEGYLKAVYPLEIMVLKLGDFDDNTEDSDLLIDSCRKVAERLALNLLTKLEETELGLIYPTDFTTEPFDGIHDDIFTGVLLAIDVGFTVKC